MMMSSFLKDRRPSSSDRWRNANSTGSKHRIPFAHRAGVLDSGKTEVQSSPERVRRRANIVPVEDVLAQTDVPVRSRCRKGGTLQAFRGRERESKERSGRISGVA